MTEVTIRNKDQIVWPVLSGEVSWKTVRQGTPGELQFKAVKDEALNIAEGNLVNCSLDGANVFYGFIFSISDGGDGLLDITAYDQIRYLKNKDSYVYENKTAGEVIRMLAEDFRLNIGVIEDTKYRIPSRVEDNTALIDMIQSALDLTLQNRKEMYVLYDDFGRLTLKNVESMAVGILIDEETAQSYDYKTTIDSEVYNKIKLVYEDENSREREVYIEKDLEHIADWGVLQYFDTLQSKENGREKAKALLSLYNKKAKSLSVKKAFGDIQVRAGSLIAVRFKLFDMELNHLMLVEKCTHTFCDGEHWMDLELRGGDFTA